MHTEYLQVVEGLARIMLDGSTRVYGPSDGIIEIPKFTTHEWQREAKGYARTDGEERKDLVVREWTVPADGQKEIFFRMLNLYLIELEPQRLHGWLPMPYSLLVWLERHLVLLQLLVVFRAMDNWPTFDEEADRVGWQTWVVTHTYIFPDRVYRYRSLDKPWLQLAACNFRPSGTTPPGTRPLCYFSWILRGFRE